MISRAQQILIKRAQAQARLTDHEYREALAIVTGMDDCRSSKDPRMTDGHVDHVMGYFEAIYWQRVDAGVLQVSCKPDAVFRKKGYWASKNTQVNTSRDRYTAANFASEIAQLERNLNQLGYGSKYMDAIKRNIQLFSDAKYAAALKRTLASKRRIK